MPARVSYKGDLNGTTRFLWGGQSNWQCLEERDSGGDLVARYTYATTYIDAVAVQERDLNGDDDFADDDEVLYYHSNTLYSVYALSDGDENVVERMRYDAYGAATVLDSDFSSDADGASDVANPYSFTGRRWDAESRLMQYRNRYYEPGLGRFVSRDPKGYDVRMSLYVAMASNPGRFTDPHGTVVTAAQCQLFFSDCISPIRDATGACVADALGAPGFTGVCCAVGCAGGCLLANIAWPACFAPCAAGCTGISASLALAAAGDCGRANRVGAKMCLKQYRRCMDRVV